MQISKTVFLIFNLLLIISCGKESSQKENAPSVQQYKYTFGSQEKEVNYLVEGESSIFIKIDGFLQYKISNKVSKRSTTGRKCFYHEDVVSLKEVHFQMQSIIDYFDFLVDDVEADYRVLENGQFIIHIPPNSKVFKVSLKEDFDKEYTLLRYSARRSKKCRKYNQDGTSRTRVKTSALGTYQRFVGMNYEVKIQPTSR